MTPLSSLCPTSRCKDLLQSLPRTLQLHLIVTQRRALEAVLNLRYLKVLVGVFLSVDLSSDAGNHHGGRDERIVRILNEHPSLYCVYCSRYKHLFLAI